MNLPSSQSADEVGGFDNSPYPPLVETTCCEDHRLPWRVDANNPLQVNDCDGLPVAWTETCIGMGKDVNNAEFIAACATRSQTDRQTIRFLLDLCMKAARYLDHPEVKAIPFAVPPDAIVEDIRKALMSSGDDYMIQAAIAAKLL